MAIVKTTRYYLPIFGSIQKDFKQISGDANSPVKEDVFQYMFENDFEFFQHFQKLNVKTERGALLKGKTLIGAYERKGAERDRPLRRINTQKFRNRQNEK